MARQRRGMLDDVVEWPDDVVEWLDNVVEYNRMPDVTGFL